MVLGILEFFYHCYFSIKNYVFQRLRYLRFYFIDFVHTIMFTEVSEIFLTYNLLIIFQIKKIYTLIFYLIEIDKIFKCI